MVEKSTELIKKLAAVDEDDKQWDNLPEELLELILSNLWRGDEIIFRSVCKTWQSIERPRRHPFPNLDGIDFSSSPWLISNLSVDNEDGKCRFFNPITNDTFEVLIPELCNSKLLFSKYGWLLMMQQIPGYRKEIFLFELLTRKKMLLPYLPELYLYWYDRGMNFLFTCPPQSSNCLVIGLYLPYFCDDAKVFIHKFGDSEWQENDIDFRDNKLRLLMDECTPVLHNGIFYCLDRTGNLVLFDPRDVACSFQVMVNSKDDPMFEFWHGVRKMHQMFMMESDGDLLAIFITRYPRKRVYVYKLGEDDYNFKLVTNLGDKMMFVSNGATFSQKTMLRGAGNKIYFSTFYPPKDDDGQCTWYSMTTKRCHSFTTSLSLANLCALAEDSNRFWFTPIH